MSKVQKFRRGDCIKVTDKMPSYMSHFDAGYIGIVTGSYEQLCGSGKLDDSNADYELIILDKDLKPISQVAWYEENQLTLCSELTRKQGKEIIDKWCYGED